MNKKYLYTCSGNFDHEITTDNPHSLNFFTNKKAAKKHLKCLGHKKNDCHLVRVSIKKE